MTTPEQQINVSHSTFHGSVLIGQAGGDLHQTLTVQVGNSTEMATLIDRVSQWTSGGSVAWSKQEFEQRKKLLHNVKRTWITGFLHQSLQNRALIELGLEHQAHQIEKEHPFQRILPAGDEAPEDLKSTTLSSISDLLSAESDCRTLLILGEPGGGKTTVLLKLAEGLLEQTETDLSRPLPVVLNLSSWANALPSRKSPIDSLNQHKPNQHKPNQQTIASPAPIDQWLVNELQEQYRISRKVGEQWVKEEQLLLLLDGLDEVSLDARNACVQAINEFTQTYVATGIIICSRQQDYQLLPTRLKLQAALCIQPLTADQVLAHLNRSGESLHALTTQLQQDPELLDLAKSPLILSIMSLVYEGNSVAFSPFGSIEERRKQLFDAYIDRMFHRSGRYQGKNPYSQTQTIFWLSWLAQRMVQDAQTIFWIEKMQPHWLPSRRLRSLYKLIGSWVFGMLLYTPIMIFVPIVLLSVLFSDGLVHALNGTVVLLGMWLAGGSLIGLGGWLMYGVMDGEIKTVETIQWSWKAVRDGWRLIVGGGTLFSIVMSLITIAYLGWSNVGWVISLSFIFSVFGLILWQGLSTPEIPNKIQPNQGMWSSVRTARIIIVRTSLICGVLLPLIGLLSGAFLGIVIAWAGGLGAAVKHFSLRVVLSCGGFLPWNYARFLDYACEKILLQRVGGGYVFIHRMLMEHFAQQEKI